MSLPLSSFTGGTARRTLLRLQQTPTRQRHRARGFHHLRAITSSSTLAAAASSTTAIPAGTAVHTATTTAAAFEFKGAGSPHAVFSLLNNRDGLHSKTTTSLLALLAGAAAAAAAGAGLVSCEEQQQQAGGKEGAAAADCTADSEDDDDPYANLPEESDDDETPCSMCRTFRKGPCRQPWRKLERCFKDHEHEENGAVSHCTRYFWPHQKCLQRYTNLYHLVSLEMKQELVGDAEKSVAMHERRSWDPDVDWTAFRQFAQDPQGGPNFRQTVPSNDKTKPLWERLPPETEPVLLTMSCPSLPKRRRDSDSSAKTSRSSRISNAAQQQQQEQEEMILKIVYAVDQDGLVLGFSYNQDYMDLLERAAANNSVDAGAPAGTEADPDGAPTTAEQQQDRTPAKKDGGGGEETAEKKKQQQSEDDGTDPTVFAFEFFVLPGETRRVKICAMYAEDPILASPDKVILDVLLYSSPSYSLADKLR